MNALVDALSEYGIRHIDMPATPERVWRAIQEARGRDVVIPGARALSGEPDAGARGCATNVRAGVQECWAQPFAIPGMTRSH